MRIQTLGLSPPEKRSAFDNPAIPLSQAIEFLSNGSTGASGEPVNAQSAMANATVQACVTLLSDTVAALPLILFQDSATGKVAATGNPLYRLLSLEPSPDGSAITFFGAMMTSLLLTGNAYAEIAKNRLDQVSGLYFLNPHQVTPERQLNGSILYKVTVTQTGQPAYRTVPAPSMIHLTYHSLDGVTGVSPITLARTAVGTNIAMEKFQGRYFANNATPSGVLKLSKVVKPEDKVTMRRDWEALQGGGSQGRTAILDIDTTYSPISMSNADSQFIESQKYYREALCGMFRVMPSQIGSEARVAGETFSQQSLSYLTNTILPLLRRLVQEFTRKLLVGRPDLSLQHDVSDLLRLDAKSHIEALASAIQSGIMNPNEARKALGLDPGPITADVYRVAVNYMNAERLLDAPAPTTITGVEDV